MKIERQAYLEKLISLRGDHSIKVVTGLRRVGKSFLLQEIFKPWLLMNGATESHIIEMSFDNYENMKYRDPAVFYPYVKSKIVDTEPYYLLLDEVQMLENFEYVLNGFLHIQNLDVYVTGSNARFLSTDVITEFRGRGVQIYVSPLSFAEFLTTCKDKSKSDAWRQYILYGGLPRIALEQNDERKAEILKDLIKETYLKDIINRNKLDNTSELEELFLLLASNIGSLTNPLKLANTFKSEKQINISSSTIKKYIDYFIDSFLVRKSLRYDIKGKKYINTPQKYYFTDMGLRNSLLGFRQIEPSHIMENVVYNELIRRNYSVDVGEVVKAIKEDGKVERRQLEVDFVCNKGYERIYIQSAYSMPDREKVKQETNSLIEIGDGFKKMILTYDNIPEYQTEEGILVKNIFDFLLEV